MDRRELYDVMSLRKCKPSDHHPYSGGNGRVDRCAQLIRRGLVKAGGVLLDVGGGIGDLGHSVRDLFERTIVLDISEKNLAAAEAKGNETVLCDVDTQGLGGKCLDGHLRIPDGSVDLVTALDFIEHVVDPESFARECRRVLRPGGHVFINTPNIRFWRHIERLWCGGSFPHTSGDREVFHGGHLAFFTYQDLRDIFEPAGLRSYPVESVMSSSDEGYEQPPQRWFPPGAAPPDQLSYVRLCLELGCPNLLYMASRW